MEKLNPNNIFKLSDIEGAKKPKIRKKRVVIFKEEIPNVIKKFKKEKKNIEDNPEIKKAANGNFLNSFKKFREQKGYE